MQSSIGKMKAELVKKHGEGQLERITRGLKQVAQFWRAEDGDAQAFEDFVRRNFIADQKTLDEAFGRLERVFEQLDGHMVELAREFRLQTDLDIGQVLSMDEIFAGYDPTAHLADDFFDNKLAFIVLLNFPLTTLDERLAGGETWSSRQWAEVRLAQRFSKRIPAQVNLEIYKTVAEAERYITEYNIWMHHVLDEKGERLFPRKMKLISHWNLRDELKADYSEKDGIRKQRVIFQVMERIITQTIPAAVINNPGVDWNPFTNEVTASTAKDYDEAVAATAKASADPEPDTRYRMFLNTFKAARKADPYSPTAPTLIARQFDESREIPEARCRKMLEDVLSSPVAGKIAQLIEERLGRPLEPFDIWYNGFRPRGKLTEAQLDEMVRKKYPNPRAFEAGMPALLEKLGFTKEQAKYLAGSIAVDPARGAGHAMGAARKSDKAHLRTRIDKSGMNYKGFNIALHEFGHNVEQTFSLNKVEHTLMMSVPNVAFTEAIAFVFQGHDLDLLGLAKPDATSEALKVLNDFWATFEIAGVSLVDIDAWHWMYEHPDATPAQLKEAVIRIAKETWNKYYAPVFGKKDVLLLGVYSHMIDALLYLPDYPIGHIIAFQIEDHLAKKGKMGPEIERMTKVGRVSPDAWMKLATGSPVAVEPFIRAAEKAAEEIGGKKK